MGLNLFPFYIPWQCLQYSTKASPHSGREQLAALGEAVKVLNRIEIQKSDLGLPQVTESNIIFPGLPH